MSETNNSALGVFSKHQDGKSAVRNLHNVVGCDSAGNRMAMWEKYGLLSGSILGLVLGSAFLIIPGLGPVMIDGPLLGWIIGALETAVVTGGLFALGGALAGSGFLRTASFGTKPR